MEFIDHRNLPGNFTLRLTADWQLGSVTCAKELIDDVLQPVRRQKNWRIAFLGDIFDRISVNDKRFSFDDFDDELAQYVRPGHKANKTDGTRPMRTLDPFRDYFEDKIAGVADKVLVLGMGNHEHVNSEESDPTWQVCDRLGIPYGGYSCNMRVNETTKMHLWHGRRSINSTLRDAHQRNAAIKQALVRTNRERWSDPETHLIAQGHVNHLMVVRPEESAKVTMAYDWERNQIQSSYEPADRRWYACVGSLQRAFVPGRTTYVEARGYHPLPLGCVDVTFKDSQIADVQEVVLG